MKPLSKYTPEEIGMWRRGDRKQTRHNMRVILMNIITNTEKRGTGGLSMATEVKLTITGILGTIIFLFLFLSFNVVSAGERGVLLTFGKPSDTVLGEGLHFKIPFVQKIVKVNTKILKGEVETNAASKDLQDVTTTVALNYHADPSNVNILYKSIGLKYGATIIDPAVREIIKEVTAQYTASELITLRQDVKTKVKALLSERLLKANIIVDDFSIVNFSFSDGFTRAIEDKQTAEQRALKAQRDLERVKFEAEQKIENAKAEAESLKLQRANVTPELIQLRQIETQAKAIEKWDGKLPLYTGSATPFINLSSVTK